MQNGLILTGRTASLPSSRTGAARRVRIYGFIYLNQKFIKGILPLDKAKLKSN